MWWKACLGVGLVMGVLAGCAAPGGGRRAGDPAAPAGPARPAASGDSARSPDSSSRAESAAGRPLERIVLALPTVSGVFVPHMLASDKGFFREEGFEVEYPVMRANLVVTALTSGDADYNGMIGPSIPPILVGQPHRVIAGVVVKSTRELTTLPEIQTVEQLRGKAIGVNSIGGGPYNSGLIAFQAFGMDPLRDVTWLQVGGTVERLAAMQQGAIQGSIFSGAEVPRARAMGFPTILQLDEVAPLPESGMATTIAKLENDREQVRRVLRALARTLQFIKSDREGSLPTFMSYLGLTPEEVGPAYDAIAYAYSNDGTVPERTLRFAIDAEKENVGVTEDVPFSRVVDFGPLYEALADLGLTPAPGSAR
jgi:ABC-type nitrate/sulfonate/bicarbonate transport system substrate-binding protein